MRQHAGEPSEEPKAGTVRRVSFDLLDLRLFLAVAEHGSITAGAELVHLTLPSASGRIRAMERAAGARLLERHRRGVTPTRHGELLLTHAREIVGRHDRLRLELADLGGQTATVTVLATTAASALVPPPLIRFLADHPGIDVALVERTSLRIVAALAEDRADLGVLSDATDLGRLDVVPLCPDPLVLAVAPRHPLATRTSVAFADALHHPFVGHAEGSALQEHLRTHAVPLGAHPRHRAGFPDAASVCRAVAAGVGIAVLPARQVDGTLVGVPLSDPWADRRLVLATRRRAALGAPARELAQRLETELSSC